MRLRKRLEWYWSKEPREHLTVTQWKLCVERTAIAHPIEKICHAGWNRFAMQSGALSYPFPVGDEGNLLTSTGIHELASRAVLVDLSLTLKSMLIFTTKYHSILPSVSGYTLR